METKCVHQKVFSNTVLCSNPPQYPWICKKCGYRGVDYGSYYDASEYDRLVDQFSGKPKTNTAAMVIDGTTFNCGNHE